MAAAGPDDPAQIQFKLPSRAAIAEFEALGLNMDHAIHDTADGGALVSAWVTDAQLANLEMRGYEPVATIADKNQIDRIRAERNATLEAQRAAVNALSRNAAGRRGASAAPGTVRAMRADYYENNVGRFLSVEAYTTLAQITCTGNNCDYTGPPIVAEYYDAAGNRLGGPVNLEEFIDPGAFPITTSTTSWSCESATKATAACFRRPSSSRPPTATSTRSTCASGSPRTRRRRDRDSSPAS